VALTTLNTGRLALPAICVGTSKWATKVAREWASERVQWGQPVGRHDAVAQKVAFIAASAFGLEAMLDVASRMADDKRNDIRIEAAIAKLYASELGWQVVDELMQVRGGRGYETAESLKARGERPVPVEQAMRDMRINRIFEGSTEIMHLLIAREAVDQHLQVAGELLEGDGDLRAKARSAVAAGAFYARWLPKLAVGEGVKPNAFDEFGELAGHLRFVERSSRKLAREIFHSMLVFRAAAERKQAFLFRVVDVANELFAIAASVSRAAALEKAGRPEAEQAIRLADAFCRQSRRRVEGLFRALWHNDDAAAYRTGRAVLAGEHAWIEKGVIGLELTVEDLTPKAPPRGEPAAPRPAAAQEVGVG
jgi:hypothetical protein